MIHFFLTIRICCSYAVSQKTITILKIYNETIFKKCSYAVSQKTIYSKKYSKLFLFITSFFNPLLPLEVSLKLQLIPKGNCLIKICIWRLFMIVSWYAKIQHTNNVPKHTAGRWCLCFLWISVVLSSGIEGTITLPAPISWWLMAVVCHQQISLLIWWKYLNNILRRSRVRFSWISRTELKYSVVEFKHY